MINDVELEAIMEMEKKAAHPPWTKDAEPSLGGYRIHASGPFGHERIAVETRYTAAFICAMRNMWPLLIEERKRYVDDRAAFDAASKVAMNTGVGFMKRIEEPNTEAHALRVALDYALSTGEPLRLGWEDNDERPSWVERVRLMSKVSP